MSIHEYVFVTISIVYGLAITRLLSKLFKAIRRGRTSTIRWTTGLWSGGVAILLVWFIWIGFSLQALEEISYGVFFNLLFTTTLLYGAAEFSFPISLAENPHAQQAERFEFRLSAAFVFAYLMSAAIANVAVAGSSWIETLTLTGVGIVISGIIAVRPSLVHRLAPVFFLYALLAHTPLQALIGLSA